MLQLIRQDLQTSIPLCRYTCNASLEFHTSISLHLQRAFRAVDLYTSTSATPAARLQSSMPPCRGASRPPNLHVATPAARLQTSIIPLYPPSSGPFLNELRLLFAPPIRLVLMVVRRGWRGGN